jgi:FdhD protein
MGHTHRRARGVLIDATGSRAVLDDLAVEEPLEIRIGDGGTTRRSVITMRTPGHDLELAAGWLQGEGVVRAADDLIAVRACTDRSLPPEARGNVVNADLAAAALPRLDSLSRSGNITGACGVCGSESVEQVLARELPPLRAAAVMDPAVVVSLPDRLAQAQRVFARTGGLHAAGAVTSAGEVLAAREDVGRHNAVDKVLGWALLSGARPDALVVTSRASFEIVQKAALAAVPVVVTVSAPSTLAVDLAERAGITLVAFTRDGRGTAYAHPERIG